MSYVATIGEREVTISVEDLGGANYKVAIDGVEHVGGRPPGGQPALVGPVPGRVVRGGT